MRARLIWLFAGLFLPVSVLGHAVLLGSSPSAGEQLSTSPDQVVLNFNENVGPVFVRLLDSTGRVVETVGDIGIDGNNLILPVTSELSDGTYIATYRVISADTHPVGGSVVFALGEAVAELGDLSETDTGASAWRIGVLLNRFLLYAAGLTAIGSVLYGLLMIPSGAATHTLQRQGLLASALVVLSLMLALPLGGAEMVAGGLAAPFSPSAWKTAFGSTLGPSLMIGLPGGLILFAAFKRNGSANSPLSWFGAALVVGSFLVTGHAATAAPVWLTATVVAVHLVCGGFWFAGLLPLRRAVGDPSIQVAFDAATRFSSLAVWTVAALFVSGAVVTWVQVETPAGMIDNAYGIGLTTKVVLFLVVLAIAAYNKKTLTPQLQRAKEGAANRLRKSIRAEYYLLVAIVFVAALLTMPTPPRALADTQQDAAASATTQSKLVQLTKGGYTAELEFSPGRPGENRVMLSVTDQAGEFVDLQDVAIELGLPAASITGVRMSGEAMAPGRYHFLFDQLVIPGEWTIQVDAFVSDFDKVILRGTVPIQ